MLFDVEKGACILVFDAPFSMSKTSFGFRHRFLYRLVGVRYIEKQKCFLVFDFRRPDWTDLTPGCFQELADRLPDAHSARFLLKASGFR